MRSEIFLATIVLALSLSDTRGAFGQASTSDPSDASSGAYIKITQANFKKSVLALPPFLNTGLTGNSALATRYGKDLYDVLRNDLDVSGYFEFMKSDAYLEDPMKTGLRPAGQADNGFRFEPLKKSGAEFLIRAGYRLQDQTLTIDLYLYSVSFSKQILARTYRGSAAELRVLSHTLANDIIKELTGTRGMFLSKIAASRTTQPDQKEIVVMDWDGANSKLVSSHRSIAVSPAWSFDGKMLAYSAFAYRPKDKKRNLDLFTLDLQTNRRFHVSYRTGINSGASYFPDGKNLVLTISTNGNPDLYKMSIDGRSLTPLTKGPRSAMNVEPNVSPDGKKIAFSSDRGGRPHIFIMNSDGTGAKAITVAGEYNSAPRWSPDGKRIVFAGSDRNPANPRKTHFDIFTVNADGTDMVRLTSAKKPNGEFADNEDPSYSPDGRHILFVSNRSGKNQLYIVTADGETEKRITFDNYKYFKPMWSPAFE